MKRFAALTGMVALLMAFGMVVAHDHGDHDVPEHGHVLVLGFEFFGVVDGVPQFTFRKCVDLAGGRALTNNAHHATVHTGMAGAALQRAGHVVIPTFDFPNCAALEAMASGE
jgi:hypothetical protein